MIIETMKRVLCLIDTLGMGGGAERQMIGLVQLLRRRGYPTEIVVYHDSEDYPEIEKRFGIKPTVLSVGNSSISKMLAVRKYIKKEGGFDFVIAYKSGASLIGCLLKASGMRFKLIVSERNVTQAISKRENLQYWLYRFADYIVPNAFTQGDFLSRHYPALKKKIHVITNFTDTELFKPVSSETLNKELNILTVGRVTPQKNIERYLDAISLLKNRGFVNVHFNWVGNPQNPKDKVYYEGLKKIQNELGLNDYITFRSQTLDIVKHYQSCDIFCLPSNFEGFPNVMCEAMSCGKPIACSRVCDNPRIVNEKENGLFFDPSNPQDMAEKLEQMINMSLDDRKQWGLRSRELAIEKFSRDAFVNKYINLMES
jgi:glycosyltransferase involved in cell wall biosynthesis